MLVPGGDGAKSCPLLGHGLAGESSLYCPELALPMFILGTSPLMYSLNILLAD